MATVCESLSESIWYINKAEFRICQRSIFPTFRKWNYNKLILEVIRQYDSCNTDELDRHVQHQQPCLASPTPRIVVGQGQPVLSATHCSSFAHCHMSVVVLFLFCFCLQRFPMTIERTVTYDTRGRHKDTRGRHANITCTPHKLEGYSCCQHFRWFLVFGSDVHVVGTDPCHTSRTAEYPLKCIKSVLGINQSTV